MENIENESLSTPTQMPKLFDMSKWNKVALKPVETLEERVGRYKLYFTLDDEQLREVELSFREEIARGLAGHRASPTCWNPKLSSLMMLDTCCGRAMPTGDETGIYYAIDFGGTNLRVVRCRLMGGGKVDVRQKKRNLRAMETFAKGTNEKCAKGLLDRSASASQLFDIIALQLKEFIAEEGDGDQTVDVGFTFSFGMNQTGLTSGSLVTWTKEFETGRATDEPVEGEDVCALLEAALRRNDVPARIVAVMNDTTGTLLCAAYERPRFAPPAAVGIILGTGVNGAYREPAWDKWRYNGVIVNTEFGNCGGALPRTDIDYTLDFDSATRGQMLFEKMVSGAYIGEIVRRMVLRIYQDRAPPKAWARGSLTTDELAKCVSSAEERTTLECFRAAWQWGGLNTADLKILQSLVGCVFARSAALAACAIVALARRTAGLQEGAEGVTVGIDGALWINNEWYRRILGEKVRAILGDALASKVHLVSTSDGSGKGAALLAMAVTKEENE
eukprot:Selendium_serpulae@DN5194_c0_g1_i1.p1